MDQGLTGLRVVGVGDHTGYIVVMTGLEVDCGLQGEHNKKKLNEMRNRIRRLDMVLPSNDPQAPRMVLPYVLLPRADGGQLDLWQYKGRRNLVIFLSHSATCQQCRRYMQSLAERYRSFQEWETEIVALVPGSKEEVAGMCSELRLPYAVAIDQSGVASFKLGLGAQGGSHGTQAGLTIADRWGEVFESYEPGEGHSLPSGEEILKTLRYIEIQCPECAVGG